MGLNLLEEKNNSDILKFYFNICDYMLEIIKWWVVPLGKNLKLEVKALI